MFWTLKLRRLYSHSMRYGIVACDRFAVSSFFSWSFALPSPAYISVCANNKKTIEWNRIPWRVPWFVCSFSIYLLIYLLFVCVCISIRAQSDMHVSTCNCTHRFIVAKYGHVECHWPSTFFTAVPVSLSLILIQTHVLLQTFDFKFFIPSLIFNWNNDEPIWMWYAVYNITLVAVNALNRYRSMFHSTHYANLFTVCFLFGQ